MASHASYRLDTGLQMSCLRITFSRPCSGELYPFVITVRKIHADAHGSGQMDVVGALIDKSCTPCKNTSFFKDSIEKFETYLRKRIFQDNYESHRFSFIFCIGSRKPFQLRFSALNPVILKKEFTDTAPVLLKYFYCGRTEISRPKHAVFLTDMFHGKNFVSFGDACSHRSGSHFQKIRIILTLMDPCSEIKLSHLSVRQDCHNITDFIVVKVECVFFAVYGNVHV